MFFAKISSAASDYFPPYQNAPALTDYVSGGIFKHTYYIAPSGNDVTGNGSINNPWKSFKGATSGGAGTSVGAGDLIYFRGGIYTPNANIDWLTADSQLYRSGASSNYIVVTAYPGETPVMTASHGVWSHSVRGNYVVIDGLTFGSGGNFLFYSSNNVIFQNNTFNFGSGEDGWGDQLEGTQLGTSECRYVTIRNNYFGGSTQHNIKEYVAGVVNSNYTIQYNRFYDNSSSFGAIAQKGSAAAWDISYNRFENIDNAIRLGQHYSGPESSGINVHHNAFDNVGVIVYQEDSGNFNVNDFNFYSNIILNGTNSKGFALDCRNSGSAFGTAYDNAFYNVSDLISCNSANYNNYPSYFNYNAETSTAIRDTAENRNSLSSLNWQGSDLILANHGITRMGEAGSWFYSVADNSAFKNRGRYGGNIGGFVFSTSSDTTPPAAPTGVTVS